MSRRGQLTETAVIGVARNIGLDIERLRRDMEDPAIEKYLVETAQLAAQLGIRGTPHVRDRRTSWFQGPSTAPA